MTEGLFQKAILDCAKDQTFAGLPDNSDGRARVDNPLCGDRVEIGLIVDGDGRIELAGHKTRGCLITKAAAHLACRDSLNCDPAAIECLKEEFIHYLKDPDARDKRFEMFAPLKAVFSRHDCATIAFDALKQAAVAAFDAAQINETGKG